MRIKNIKWISLIALLLTSALFVGTVKPASARIYVDPPLVADIYPPNTFTVDIKVDVEDLYGWEFTLGFIPSVLQVVSIAQGPFLSTAGPAAFFPPLIDNLNGFVTAGEMLMMLSGPGASGTGGILATVTFGVIGYGVGSVDLYNTDLLTVVSGYVKPISHAAEDGVFDNRVEKKPPNAIFTIVPPVVTEGLPITFDAQASNDDDDGGWIVSYLWDFGDGTTDFGETVSHTFATIGMYTVTLTVFDNDGLNDTMVADIDVFKWIDAGWFPDLVQKCAWPEWPNHKEWEDGRELPLWARVSNPTETDFEVKVEFEIYSKDEADLLGLLSTDICLMPGGSSGQESIQEISVIFDTSDVTWRCKSGGGEWVDYVGWLYPFKKYIAFARCYWRELGTIDWQQGFVTKYLSWNVYPARHDIGIVSMEVVPDTFEPGEPLSINLNVTNNGAMDETFDLTARFDVNSTVSIPIGVEPMTLAPGEWQLVNFDWTAPDVDPGVYLIKAELPTLTYEKDKNLPNNKALVVVIVE